MSQSAKEDLLVRYAIHLAGAELQIDIPENDLSFAEKEAFERILTEEPELSQEVQLVKATYIEVYRQMETSPNGDIELQPPKRKSIYGKRLFQPIRVRYPVYAATVLAIGFFSLIAIRNMTSYPYLAIIDQSLAEKLTVARNEASSPISFGKAFFNMGEYPKAINIFTNELQKLGAGDQLSQKAVLAFYRGRAYLSMSQTSTLGLFLSFRMSNLDSANLSFSQAAANVEQDASLRHDINWYIGIVALLRYQNTTSASDLDKAIESLASVVDDNKKWSEQSKAVLHLIK